MYLLGLFEGTWEKGQCDLVCVALLDDWAMLVYVDVLSRVVSVVLTLWGVGSILRNGCGIWGHEFNHS